MATMFKTFLDDDIATTRTLLHEAVPVSGGIVDSTSYDESLSSETNIKNYTHEMFQSVYDYSYTKSSSNHIFDVTVGLTKDSDWNAAGDLSAEKKQIIYNEFAQILAGHKVDGTIRTFDADGNYSAGGTEHPEAYIISIARLLNKDEIKKGSFYIKLNVQSNDLGGPGHAITNGARQELLISDEGAADDYKVNSPAGDYGILKCRTYKHFEGHWAPSASGVSGKNTFTQTSSNEIYTLDYDPTDNTTGYADQTLTELNQEGLDINAGLIFYQAGVIILSPYIFKKYNAAPVEDDGTSTKGKLPSPTNADGYGNPVAPGNTELGENEEEVDVMFQNKTIPVNCNALRKRIHQIAFNNTTELNSTIYFCRVNHNDFNYSSNPTYLDKGKIRVKQITSDAPISYITSVGLYSANNELLAVAKLSEPLRKDPTNEMVLRVRLDY